MNAPILDTFKNDISRHEMQIIRDDGLYRHIRFKRTGTMAMHFDLLTWPGYLCYTGDMGTYVFYRLEDMFQFFRRSDQDRMFKIDKGYWAQKCQASDRDGIEEFSHDIFAARIKERFDEFELTDAEARAELWDEIDQQIIRHSHDGEALALSAVYNFEHEGANHLFQDFFEINCREYTFRFQWCCYALAWAIDQYDAAKEPA